MHSASLVFRGSGARAVFATLLALACACPSGCRAPADDAGSTATGSANVDGRSPATVHANVDDTPREDGRETPPVSGAGPGHAEPAPDDPLREDSTLAEWLAAAPRERSTLAVALARRAKGEDAPKLDLAKAAMEITGCLTRTASDPAMASWKVGATASMCLTAEER